MRSIIVASTEGVKPQQGGRGGRSPPKFALKNSSVAIFGHLNGPEAMKKNVTKIAV